MLTKITTTAIRNLILLTLLLCLILGMAAGCAIKDDEPTDTAESVESTESTDQSADTDDTETDDTETSDTETDDTETLHPEGNTITDIADWDSISWDRGNGTRIHGYQLYDFFKGFISGMSAFPEISGLGITDYSITRLSKTYNGAEFMFDFTVTGNTLPETLPPGDYTWEIRYNFDNISPLFLLESKGITPEKSKIYGLDNFDNNPAAEAVHDYISCNGTAFDVEFGRSDAEALERAMYYTVYHYRNENHAILYTDLVRLMEEKFGITDIGEFNWYYSKCMYYPENGTVIFEGVPEVLPHRIIDVREEDGISYVTVQLYADNYFILPDGKVEFMLGEDEVFLGSRIVESKKYGSEILYSFVADKHAYPRTDTITDIADWDSISWDKETSAEHNYTEVYNFFYGLVSGESPIPELSGLGIRDYTITLLEETSDGNIFLFNFTVTGDTLPETLPPGEYTWYISNIMDDVRVYEDEIPRGTRDSNIAHDKRYRLDEFGGHPEAWAVHEYLSYNGYGVYDALDFGRSDSEAIERAMCYITKYYGDSSLRIPYPELIRLMEEKFGITGVTEIDCSYSRCAYDPETGTYYFADTRGYFPVHRITDVREEGGITYVTVQFYADRYFILPARKVEFMLGKGEVFLGSRIVEYGNYEIGSVYSYTDYEVSYPYIYTITDIADWDTIPWEESSDLVLEKNNTEVYDFFYSLISGKSSIPEINGLGITDYSITVVINYQRFSKLYFIFNVTGNTLPETLPPGNYTWHMYYRSKLLVYENVIPRSYDETTFYTRKSYGLDAFGDYPEAVAVNEYLTYCKPVYDAFDFGTSTAEAVERAMCYIAKHYGYARQISYTELIRLMEDKFGITEVGEIDWENSHCSYDPETDIVTVGLYNGVQHRITDVREEGGITYVTVQFYADQYFILPAKKTEFMLGEGEVFLGSRDIHVTDYAPLSVYSYMDYTPAGE